MQKSNVVVSPKFELALQDLKSVLTGLALMTAGTIVTALIDVLIKWFSGLDNTIITIWGFPVMVYTVPLVTAALNYIRKYVTETKYTK